MAFLDGIFITSTHTQPKNDGNEYTGIIRGIKMWCNKHPHLRHAEGWLGILVCCRGNYVLWKTCKGEYSTSLVWALGGSDIYITKNTFQLTVYHIDVMLVVLDVTPSHCLSIPGAQVLGQAHPCGWGSTPRRSWLAEASHAASTAHGNGFHPRSHYRSL